MASSRCITSPSSIWSATKSAALKRSCAGAPRTRNVPPGDFIRPCRETGLIVPLGEWVLRQACAEAATWPDHLKIAVNVSPAQFKARNLADVVVRTLAATGMAPQRLELEITELVMLQDEEAALVTLTRLHDPGVRIALDDFGTGYSSLSNLRNFRSTRSRSTAALSVIFLPRTSTPSRLYGPSLSSGSARNVHHGRGRRDKRSSWTMCVRKAARKCRATTSARRARPAKSSG